MNSQNETISPSLKPNELLLKKVVQGFKLVNLDCNHAEIAMFADISKGTVHNKRDMVADFWSEESLTPDEDKRFILEKSIELGIKETLTAKEPSLVHVYGAILGSCLKVETDILDKVGTIKSSWTVGSHLTKLFLAVHRRKDEKGTPVHSENTSAKYVRELLEVDRLFNCSKGYKTGERAKSWSAKNVLNEFIEKSNSIFLHMLSQNPLLFIPLFPTSHMSLSNDIKNSSRKEHLTIHYYNIYTILKIHLDILRTLEVQSVFSLLIRTITIEDGEIHVPVKHESTKSPEYFGRDYNIFCFLRSQERRVLGYIGYDMSAAMQSICLQLVQATEDEYPMLWCYAHDKAFKERIREEIAQALNVDTKEVKATLTAYANGSMEDKDKHPLYKVFQEESNRLRRAVLKHVSENEPKVLARAIEQSSREMPKGWNWSDTEQAESNKERLSASSIFFFVWTFYERDIRQAMLMILEDGLEVHDAVYSKMDVDVKVVEQEIFDQTGYTITIEKE